MWREAEERLCLDERRHPIVLTRAFLQAALVGTLGGALAVVGWPVSVAGAAALAVAATIALRAVWRWERTRVRVTTDTLAVVDGTLRRRAATVSLARVGPVEVEQTLVGRLLGYGTVVAGDLEIAHVPEPRRLADLVGRLARR